MMQLSNIKKEVKNENIINIDLNCDIGQSFGVYRNEMEMELLPYVRTVNVSCGSHAGDPVTIMNMLKIAYDKNLAVGAHIGYPDIQGFGYREMNLSEEEIKALVIYQIGALSSLAKTYNVNIEHVRPHGALYKQASENKETAVNIAKAIAKYDPWLILVGAPGENLKIAGEEANIRVAPEIQLDKIYNIDGSIDFSESDKIDIEYSKKVLRMAVNESCVPNKEGGKTKICFNTIHLSMKSAISLELAKEARSLIQNPIPVAGTFVADSGWVQ